MFYRRPMCVLFHLLILALLMFSLIALLHHDAIVTMDTALAAGHLAPEGQGLLEGSTFKTMTVSRRRFSNSPKTQNWRINKIPDNTSAQKVEPGDKKNDKSSNQNPNNDRLESNHRSIGIRLALPARPPDVFLDLPCIMSVDRGVWLYPNRKC